MNERISIARRMKLLLEHTPNPHTRPSTVIGLAEAIGLTQQTLQNILHERIDNPRLNTLRALCGFYKISLDYFDLPTEETCRHYLAAQQLKTAPMMIHQIDHETHSLTERGQHNILSSLEWMNAASPF